MTDDGRNAGTDPLALAEAVASGELSDATAESTLRAARGSDTRRADADVAEMRDLVAAIRGVRRHAEAFQRAADEAGVAESGPAPPVIAPAPCRADSGPWSADDRTPACYRGDVRLRPSRPVDRSRWAMSGALAAAAVIVVAVVVGAQLTTSRIAATPSPSSPVAIVSPRRRRHRLADRRPTTDRRPDPDRRRPQRGSACHGVPPIVSEALGGTPGIVYWTLTAEDRISVSEWNPNGDSAGRSRSRSTRGRTQARADGIWIERRVVASPDGRHVAFSEWDRQATGAPAASG